VNAEQELGTVKIEFATDDTSVVALVGEHDLHSRAALKATLAYAAQGRNVLVDLSSCTFVDSAIISLLLATQRTLNAQDGRCELIIPTQAGYVTRLFEITGIEGLFTVHASRAVALESVRSSQAAAAEAH